MLDVCAEPGQRAREGGVPQAGAWRLGRKAESEADKEVGVEGGFGLSQ